MEQKKGKVKNILLLIGTFLAALGVNFGIQIVGCIIVMVYLIAGQNYSVNDAMTRLTSFDVITGLTCVMHVSFIILFGIWYKLGFTKKNKIPLKKIYCIRNVVCFIILGVGLQFCLSYLLQVVNILFPALMENYMALLETMDLGNSWLMFVVSVLLAPIGEELIFRGVMLGYAKRVMPFLWANLFQAILFGVFHMNLVQGLYAFGLGLLLGYLVQKCDSILASIAVHFAVNGSGNLLSFLSSGSSETTTTETIGLIPVLIFSAIFAGICAVACYFVKGRSREE